jgi:hypothetical protein
MEFRVEISKHGDCMGCDSCGCDENIPTALFDCRSALNHGAQKRLCEICASTSIGAEYEYRSHRDMWPLLQTIAQVGNILLAEIRKNRAPALAPLAPPKTEE